MPITDEQIDALRRKGAALPMAVKQFIALKLDFSEEDMKDVDVCVMVGARNELTGFATCDADQTIQMCISLLNRLTTPAEETEEDHGPH